MKKNMIIAQSGGPSAVINASLAGAIKRGLKEEGLKIFGSLYGLEGILKNEIVLLNEVFKDEKNIENLKNTPAMALGSCRYKIKEDSEDYDKILKTLEELEVGYFFYIGGNDSMDTVDKLSKFFKNKGHDIKVVGIPKTIDNDLMNTDHTPGFSSAAKYVATSIREVFTDTLSYDKPTVTFVEIMGRNAGWLAASSVMARANDCNAPHMIYLPERPFNEDEFKRELEELSKKEKVILVAVSEGIKLPDGTYFSASESQSHDKFGHAMLKGAGTRMEAIAKEMGFKTRTIELSLLQRSAGHLVSKVDVEEAFTCGYKAVEMAMDGKTGIMVAMERTSNNPYKVEYVPVTIGEVSNKEKSIPLEWIDGNDVTKEFIEYMRPLLGENPFKDHFRLDRKALYKK